jgi:MFS family permease
LLPANTISAIGGFVGPLVVAALTSAYPGIAGWRAAFYLTAAMAAVGLLTWSIYQTSEIVPELNTPLKKK